MKIFSTTKILSIAATAAAVFGAFAVFGLSPALDTVKLNPTGVSIGSSGGWVEDSAVWALFDRDTTSAYTPIANVTNILVTLPAETDLTAIKVYGSASFDIKIYEDTSGTWVLLPGMPIISLKSQTEAWSTFKPSSPIRISRLMLEISRSGDPLTGIKEIELWGTEAGDPPSHSGRRQDSIGCEDSTVTNAPALAYNGAYSRASGHRCPCRRNQPYTQLQPSYRPKSCEEGVSTL